MKKTEDDYVTLLLFIAVLSMLVSGAIFYFYEDYLENMEYVNYYQINFTPDKDDLYESAKVSFYYCGTYSNDSNAVQAIRKRAIAERNEFIDKTKSYIVEEQAKIKQLKKSTNENKYIKEAKEGAYKELLEADNNKLDSVSSTECYVFRVTYTRDFKIEDFETVISGSSSTIDGLIDNLKTYTDIHPDGTFVYYRVL